MDFFKNFKDKVNERLFLNDEEYEEEYDEEEVNREDFSEKPAEPMFEGDMTPPAYNSYSYSPTGGLEAPEYAFGKTAGPSTTYTSGPSTTFTGPSSMPDFTTPPASSKKGGTIYDMPGIRPTHKFKLTSITLHEIYGAKEVALLMMEKDTIIIVNFSELSEAQKLRAMDFLDGARCVTNAIFARLNENIIVFVPENVELCGDFQSQVDLESIK